MIQDTGKLLATEYTLNGEWRRYSIHYRNAQERATAERILTGLKRQA